MYAHVLLALGLKDRYLIPSSGNNICQSDTTPSPELFLQHYVIGLPSQKRSLNKPFGSSPRGPGQPCPVAYTHTWAVLVRVNQLIPVKGD